MKKAITVLGLGAAAVAFSVGNVNAMEANGNTTVNTMKADDNAAANAIKSNDNAAVNAIKSNDGAKVNVTKADANVSTAASSNDNTTADINLREQPSATSNKVSELKSGAKLNIIEKNNGWAKVSTEDGKSGWVSGYYLSKEDGAAKNKNAQAQNDNDKAQQVQNSNAQAQNNVKDETEKDSLQKDSAQAADSGVVSNGKLASTGILNLRTGPSTSNSITGKIYKGEIFKVVSKSPTGWYKVILNDGSTGWASGDYIQLTNENDKTNIAVQNNDKDANASESVSSGRVNSSVGLNIRAGAGTNTAVIGTLASNQKVNIISKDNGWYKIKLDNGQTGYVGASYISAITNSVEKESADAPQETKNDKVSSASSDSKTQASATESKSQASGSVVDLAKSLIGTRYSWGGTSTSGFDCSGFTQYVFKNAAGVDIPRVSSAQAGAGKAVSMSSIQPGDLLYFDTTGSGRTSHVGIYMGNGQFIHASGTATNPEYVKISNLSESWVKCLGARRI